MFQRYSISYSTSNDSQNDDDNVLVMEKQPEYRRAMTRPSSINIPKPLQVLSRLSPKSHSVASEVKRRASSISVQEETIPKAAWIVENHNVPPVPDFPLETHGCQTITNSDASTIAHRLQEYCRRHSIVVQYDSSTASAKCTTSSQMTFWIHLYSQVSDKSIVMEVQRWSNCGIAFRSTRKELWDVARGMECTTQESKTSPSKKRRTWVAPSLPSNLPPMEHVMSSAQENEEDMPHPALDVSTRVEQAMKQLQSSRNNTLLQRNELEALEQLVNVDLTPSIQATAFSKQVLFHPRLRSYLCQRLNHVEPFSSSCSSSSYPPQVHPLNHSILSLLYTCLFTLSKQQDDNRDVPLSHYISHEYTFVSTTLLPTLLQQSSLLETPHNAWLGTKGLKLLLLISDELRQEAMQQFNIEAILKKAKHCGQNCHMGLREEAKLAMGLVSSS